MKKLLLSSVALATMAGTAIAADLPSRKAPVIAPPAPPIWTGFHAGLNAGGIWNNNNSVTATTWPADAGDAVLNGVVPSGGSAAFIGGGQIGYDWQFNNGTHGFVAGFETDIQGVAGGGGNGANHGSVIPVDIFPDIGGNDFAAVTSANSSKSISYLGTVRGRIGYLVTPTLLVYGTGGLAYGGVNMSLGVNQSLVPIVAGATGGDTGYGYSNYANTQVGWTAGGGMEWMFAPNWSAKAEYLYYDLGNSNAKMTMIGYDSADAGSDAYFNGSSTTFTSRFNGNIVRAGVNYHFNFANVVPVVAKF